MTISVPSRIGTNVLPGRVPGGFSHPMEDAEMQIETYSSYRPPEQRFKNTDHRLVMEAGNRVLERRVEINNVR